MISLYTFPILAPVIADFRLGGVWERARYIDPCMALDSPAGGFEKCMLYAAARIGIVQ